MSPTASTIPADAWADRRILDLFGVQHPLVQAPMAGAQGSALAIAVSEAGGLGSLPCAMLTPAQIRAEVAAVRAATSRPFALNYFCHAPPMADEARSERWAARLAPFFAELDIPTPSAGHGASGGRAPFDEAAADLLAELTPAVVSFHFGLPSVALLARARASGARIVSSATTVEEARWLEDNGCDAIIAQGAEAGGHRAMFLAQHADTQPTLFTLLPQVADAVRVPVIAAGGIMDGRGIVAALTLGAAAVQLGTAFLFCPEATIGETHRRALREVPSDGTVLTNVFSGRPARGVDNRLIRTLGPIAEDAPSFPLAGGSVAPLRAASEARGRSDFAQMWSGQGARLGRALPAGALTRTLLDEAAALLSHGGRG